MLDITSLIQAGTSNPWLYLPLAIALGALHALEPGHSKSMMAAFIIATRGTPAQAALLGCSAAVGHTLVIWLLAALGLFFGNSLILHTAEPWLILLSGLLILALAIRMFFMFRSEHHHHHHDSHAHQHESHAEQHEREITQKFANRPVTNLTILWFGLTGGLLPCPSALAVLLICIQLKAFVLGFAMVAGFSLGLAITLVSVGLLAAWGAQKAAEGWSGFSHWAEKLPILSALLIGIIGLAITVKGLMAVHLL